MTDTRKQVSRIGKAKAEADLIERRMQTALQARALRRQGKSWYEIGSEMGIAHTEAKRLVDEVIVEAARLVDAGTKTEMLMLEVERLDAMLSAVWADAVTGDIAAVREVRANVMDRAKLLGLMDQVQTAAVNTVIVPTSSEEYVAALKMIAAGGQS